MQPKTQFHHARSDSTLPEQLRSVVRGEVRFDDTSRALYASDASNYRQVPIGVVLPKDEQDVLQTLAICHKVGAPVLPRGGGTSLCGQACNTAVVIDMSKYMNRILQIDPQSKCAWVEPGVVLDDLRHAAEEHHLTFAPDPSTHNHNTLGGMIGNNSCGPHSVMGGRTCDNVLELDILTYDGTRMMVGATTDEQFQEIIQGGGRKAEIYQALKELATQEADEIRKKTPKIPRLVSGFNLYELLPQSGFQVARALTGSEGTCCVVLKARVQLVDSPPERVLVALGYPSVFDAADQVPKVMEHNPVATEGVDDKLVRDMQAYNTYVESVEMLPEGRGWLLIEFGGATQEEAIEKANSMLAELGKESSPPSSRLYCRPEKEQQLWRVRRSALGVTAHPPHKDITWEGWEDSAVPPDQLGGYLRELQKLYDDFGYEGDFYGHFGQGCVHTRINFDLRTATGIDHYKNFIQRAADLVLQFGGSLSGEHGDGQSKAQFLNKMYGDEMVESFQRFKTIWDPDWKMNPGKVVHPYAIDENLRLGKNYNPAQPKTYFSYQGDQGNFARATLRCVGVGECRKHDSGTMCPSYMATREEQHSTRGRAHLLFEMLQGDVIKDPWRNRGVKESLDLCLSCKGCLNECPVNVDMATYKAEFMAHYYRHRPYPPSAIAFGRINDWLRLGSHWSGAVNFLTRRPITAKLLKYTIGVAQQRQLPQIAEQSFTHWFFSRKEPTVNSNKSVILWPDTFHNYLRPASAVAAVEVLEANGYQVIVPQKPVCCGRPLYEFGMLDLAKKRMENVLQSIRGPLRDGVPVVMLEPSCASVFLHDAPQLKAADEDTRRLQQQTMLFAEFVEKHLPDVQWGKLGRPALLHGHCHQKALSGLADDARLLEKIGVTADIPDDGCCGMAGAFGFEKDKYEVSCQIGERVLLPRVREAPEDTLIISNGFSCREQIEQCTSRQPMHISEVVNLARQARAEE